MIQNTYMYIKNNSRINTTNSEIKWMTTNLNYTKLKVVLLNKNWKTTYATFVCSYVERFAPVAVIANAFPQSITTYKNKI